jgi:hypothetical protein
LKPSDLRNATWAEALTHVTADMRRVHAAYRDHGRGTTRAVARKAGISLLTLRPRTTDLYKLGLVECVDKHGTSGVYEYRTEAQAEASQAWREDRTSHKQGDGRAQPAAGVPTFATEEQKVAWAASILGHFAQQRRRRAIPAGAVQLDLLPAA